MRFDSHFVLNKFIMGLCMMGYTTPFIDYKTDMEDKGLNKHIHLYRAELKLGDREVYIIFKDLHTEVYRITLKKRGV